MFRKVSNPGDEMNERVWSIGGMILAGKKWSNQTKTYPRATLSTNATWTGLGLTPALCSEGSVTAWAMAQPEQMVSKCMTVLIQRISYFTNHPVLYMQDFIYRSRNLAITNCCTIRKMQSSFLTEVGRLNLMLSFWTPRRHMGNWR